MTSTQKIHKYLAKMQTATKPKDMERYYAKVIKYKFGQQGGDGNSYPWRNLKLEDKISGSAQIGDIKQKITQISIDNSTAIDKLKEQLKESEKHIEEYSSALKDTLKYLNEISGKIDTISTDKIEDELYDKLKIDTSQVPPITPLNIQQIWDNIKTPSGSTTTPALSNNGQTQPATES